MAVYQIKVAAFQHFDGFDSQQEAQDWAIAQIQDPTKGILTVEQIPDDQVQKEFANYEPATPAPAPAGDSAPAPAPAPAPTESNSVPAPADAVTEVK